MSTVLNLRPHPQPRRRVLIVEDNLDCLHSMAVLLKSIGHEVQFAINGFAALEIARKFRPEIVLLDIGLPDFDGDNIARQLRWEPGLERTRIIAISGRAGDEAQRRALESGCERFYVKPVEPAVLEELLAQP